MYWFDIFRISFGLARLGISKIQNSVKGERDPVMQNCSNLENGSFNFLIKKKNKPYVNAYTLLTLAYRIIFCGMGDKMKINNSFRKPQSLETFPLYQFFSFCRFV